MDIRSNPQIFNAFADITLATKYGQPLQAQGSRVAVTAANFDGDRAQLSPAASLIGQAAAAPVSDVRQEKVDSIRQALASGSYDVSPADVAGKLIEHLLE